MIIKGKIKKGEYFDSVSLMLVAKELNKTAGVIESSVIMGTKENMMILKAAGLYIKEFESVKDSDLLISIKAENNEIANNSINSVDEILKKLRNKSDNKIEFLPKSFDSALKQMPDANFSLISIAGKYAANEAWKALRKGLHVMIFSDNVSLEDEIALKKYASEKGLLVMGPDCGTAIINGIPLAFANVVNSGNIGLVGASGTGLQEVTSIISNEGCGISQAIGTGGRDVKKEVGGIMFIDALKALNIDEKTKIIVLVSKPPHEEVLLKISQEIKNIKKPVVAVFIGAQKELIEKSGAIAAETLEEAALIAVALSKIEDFEKCKINIENKNKEIINIAKTYNNTFKGKYLRGLYSGGTLCDEAQLILKKYIGYVYSNTPLNQEFKLKDSWISEKNTIIDMGEDEFTSGRPHPMIDFSLRKKKITDESLNKDVAIILLDVVLGYGSNLNPDEELVSAIKKAKDNNPDILIICSITGTDNDPQNRKKVKQNLENAGAIVMNSNVAASELTGILLTQN